MRTKQSADAKDWQELADGTSLWPCQDFAAECFKELSSAFFLLCLWLQDIQVTPQLTVWALERVFAWVQEWLCREAPESVRGRDLCDELSRCKTTSHRLGVPLLPAAFGGAGNLVRGGEPQGELEGKVGRVRKL